MKKQRNLIISMTALLVILVGAYILYSNLSKTYAPGSNLAEIQQNITETDTYSTEQSQSSDESAPSNESADDEKYEAPDFTVYDYEGNAHNLSDYRGKPVVLNFWASWCGPCKSEMPEFDAAYAEYGSELHFLIVNLTDGASETVESAKSYIDSQGYSFPVYYDTDMDAAMKYGVSSIPATYFIDADGYLAAYGIGALDRATLEKGIGMAKKEAN